MGRPAVVKNENDESVLIPQPLISDVVDIGEDEFNRILLPFILTPEMVFSGAEDEEELVEKFHIYELFFMELENDTKLLDNIFEGQDSLEVLMESLSYFFKTDNVKLLKNRKKIIINDSYLIDKGNFDDVRKSIQSVTCRKDVEVEKPPRNMTERQKGIWDKLQKGRRRTAEKNALHMQDLISYVSLGGNSYISLDKIDKMTFYQLQHAYKSIIGKDSYEIGMSYKLSAKFDVKDDVKHWTESLKIGK